MTFDADAIHKALASPVRRTILAWLKAPDKHFPASQAGPFPQGVCAGQIDALCGLSQSTVPRTSRRSSAPGSSRRPASANGRFSSATTR